MYKLLIVFIFLSGVGLSFQSCSTGAASGELTEKDNNKTIELEMDSPFTIRLTGEHGSGYRWKLVSDNKPAVILKNTDVSIQGNDDVYIFNFMVKNQGEEEVVIVFASDDVVVKTFKLKVICGTMGRILSE